MRNPRGALLRDARVPAGVDLGRLARAVVLRRRRRRVLLLRRRHQRRHGLVHLALAERHGDLLLRVLLQQRVRLPLVEEARLVHHLHHIIIHRWSEHTPRGDGANQHRNGCLYDLPCWRTTVLPSLQIVLGILGLRFASKPNQRTASHLVLTA